MGVDDDVMILYISKTEYQALQDIIVVSAEEEAIIDGAIVTGGKVALTGSYSAFDDLAGSVAGEANHCTSRQKEMVLDRLYDKIGELLGQDY